MRYIFIILLFIAEFSWAEIAAIDYFMAQEERENISQLRNQVSGLNKYNQLDVLLDSSAIDSNIDEFRVNALLDVQSNKLVEINGIYFAEGEKAAGIKIYSISNNYVVLSFMGIKGKALIGKKYSASNW